LKYLASNGTAFCQEVALVWDWWADFWEGRDYEIQP
jgi:hypothetical protein